MSADAASSNPNLSRDHASERRDASPAFAPNGALPGSAEVDVLRNSLSAVMAEYHDQSKKFTTVAADHARQSQEITAVTAQNLQLSRDVTALAGERDALATARAAAAARYAAAEAECDALRSKCSELEKRLIDIESSTSWVATRRLRELLARHPKLRRVARMIWLPPARP